MAGGCGEIWDFYVYGDFGVVVVVVGDDGDYNGCGFIEFVFGYSDYKRISRYGNDGGLGLGST